MGRISVACFQVRDDKSPLATVFHNFNSAKIRCTSQVDSESVQDCLALDSRLSAMDSVRLPSVDQLVGTARLSSLLQLGLFVCKEVRLRKY